MMAPLTRSHRILIYGAVSATAPKPSAWQSLKTSLKIPLLSLRDLILWRAGSSKYLDYRNYLFPSVSNRGDEAICAAVRQQLLRADPELEFIDVNWGQLQQAIGDSAENTIDLIVVAGSGYISLDGNGNLAARIKQDLDALSMTAIPLVLYGVGVNQLLAEQKNNREIFVAETSKANLRRILARASLISVRDRAAQKLLTEFSAKAVRLTSDPALYFDDAHPVFADARTTRPTQPLVGISMAFHGPKTNAQLKLNLPAYIDMLKRLQKQSNCRYLYFVHFDAELIIPKLFSLSGVAMEVVRGSPEILVDAYRKLNLHIGEMLHSCILATSAGVPAISLAYDIKHFGFFKLIDVEQHCFSSMHFDPNAVLRTALHILKNESEIRGKILERRKVLERDADRFIDDCIHLISDTAQHPYKEAASGAGGSF